MKARVFYGFSKLTKKVVRKPELAVYFENAVNNPLANEEWINRKMTVAHVRNQTSDEFTDAIHSNRIWTKYHYYIDEKPFNGDIDHVLERNFQADVNNVPINRLMQIRQDLRIAFFAAYKRKDDNKQFTLFNYYG